MFSNFSKPPCVPISLSVLFSRLSFSTFCLRTWIFSQSYCSVSFISKACSFNLLMKTFIWVSISKLTFVIVSNMVFAFDSPNICCNVLIPLGIAYIDTLRAQWSFYHSVKIISTCLQNWPTSSLLKKRDLILGVYKDHSEYWGQMILSKLSVSSLLLRWCSIAFNVYVYFS